MSRYRRVRCYHCGRTYHEDYVAKESAKVGGNYRRAAAMRQVNTCLRCRLENHLRRMKNYPSRRYRDHITALEAPLLPPEPDLSVLGWVERREAEAAHRVACNKVRRDVRTQDAIDRGFLPGPEDAGQHRGFFGGYYVHDDRSVGAWEYLATVWPDGHLLPTHPECLPEAYRVPEFVERSLRADNVRLVRRR